jgi:hypothetical protein
MSDWISVKEQHPPYGSRHRFLFFTGKKQVTFGWAWNPEEGWVTYSPESIWIADCDGLTTEVATHWMPLPNAPKNDS